MAVEEQSVDHDHANIAGGWLRPAVFGAMDGLVSNLALIAGVAAGTEGSGSSKAVVLAGFAGLAAGAFSMAAGEFTSVASQSELAEAEIDKERQEIEANPDAERDELAERMTEAGIDRETAALAAAQVHRNLEDAVMVHSRAELGVAPGELASPWVASISSFLSFGVGALVPLVPYLLGASALLPGLLLTLLALFACGAIVTRVTVRPWWYGGLRQMLLGGAAALLTYLIGKAVGSTGLG